MYRFARFWVQLYLGKYKIQGADIDCPCVLVTRHQFTLGPIALMCWLDLPVRLWVLDKLVIRERCLEHFERHTGPNIFHMGPRLSRLFARTAAPPYARLFESMRAIPVFRGQKEIIKTFALSLEALKNGHAVALAPDIDYTSRDDEAGGFYSGFLHLAKAYKPAEGQPQLPFYPVFADARTRTIHVGQPVRRDVSVPFHEDRERMLEELRSSLNRMARECEALPDRQRHKRLKKK